MLDGICKLAIMEKRCHEKILKQTEDNVFANEIGQRFKRLCEEIPIIKKLGWAQYKPYFNDGEECVFEVHGFSIAFSDEIDNDSLAHYGNVITHDGTLIRISSIGSEVELSSGNSEYRKKMNKAILNLFTLPQRDAIREFFKKLNNLDTDVLKLTFGDHALVVFSTDGLAHVSRFQHD